MLLRWLRTDDVIDINILACYLHQLAFANWSVDSKLYRVFLSNLNFYDMPPAAMVEPQSLQNKEDSTLSPSGDHGSPADISDLAKASLFAGQYLPTKAPEDRPMQHLIDFEGTNDASNPVNWSKGYKWAMVVLLSTINIIA